MIYKNYINKSLNNYKLKKEYQKNHKDFNFN